MLQPSVNTVKFNYKQHYFPDSIKITIHLHLNRIILKCMPSSPQSHYLPPFLLRELITVLCLMLLGWLVNGAHRNKKAVALTSFQNFYGRNIPLKGSYVLLLRNAHRLCHTTLGSAPEHLLYTGSNFGG